MKKKLLTLAAALLLMLPAACMHHARGPHGQGGPGCQKCSCPCRQQQGEAGKPADCPKKDCPTPQAGCPKTQGHPGHQAPEAPAK